MRDGYFSRHEASGRKPITRSAYVIPRDEEDSVALLTENFTSYFGAVPLHYSLSASEAINATCHIILHIEQHHFTPDDHRHLPEDGPQSNLDNPPLLGEKSTDRTSDIPKSALSRKHPFLAFIEGGYGAGFGEGGGASCVESWRRDSPASMGQLLPWPEIGGTRSGDAPFDKYVKELADLGCLAIVVELVSGQTGRIMSKEEWKTLHQTCRKYNLYVIVDETLTAIRSGHPFFFRHEWYRELLPDLVVFGKGIGISGLALPFHWAKQKTPTIWSKYEYNGAEDRRQKALEIADSWQERLTTPITDEIALKAAAIIHLAQAMKRDENAERIGACCEKILGNVYKELNISETLWRRTGAMIHIQRTDDTSSIALTAKKVGAGATQCTRWYPSLVLQDWQLDLFHLKEFSDKMRDFIQSHEFVCKTCIECAWSSRMEDEDGEFKGRVCDGCGFSICGNCDSQNFHESDKCEKLQMKKQKGLAGKERMQGRLEDCQQGSGSSE